MNAEVLSRIAQIKHYINTLSGSIASKENTQASAVISQFKQSMIKADPYEQTNQFILDCLKAKNEKLKQELYEIQS